MINTKNQGIESNLQKMPTLTTDFFKKFYTIKTLQGDNLTWLSLVAKCDDGGKVKKDKRGNVIFSDKKIKELQSIESGFQLAFGDEIKVNFLKLVGETYRKYRHYFDNPGFFYESQFLSGQRIMEQIMNVLGDKKDSLSDFFSPGKRAEHYFTNQKIYDLITPRLDARERAGLYVNKKKQEKEREYIRRLNDIFEYDANMTTDEKFRLPLNKDIIGDIISLGKKKGIKSGFLENILYVKNPETTVKEFRSDEECEILLGYINDFFNIVGLIGYYDDEKAMQTIQPQEGDDDKVKKHKDSCNEYKNKIDQRKDSTSTTIKIQIGATVVKNQSIEHLRKQHDMLEVVYKYIISPAGYGNIKQRKQFFDQYQLFLTQTKGFDEVQKTIRENKNHRLAHLQTPQLYENMTQVYTPAHSSYFLLDAIFAEAGYDPSYGGNKERFREGLPAGSSISWNRVGLNPLDTEGINEQLDVIMKNIALFIEYAQLKVKDPNVQKRLAAEMNLQNGLEEVYFGDITQDHVFRADIGFPGVYELDDFPRGLLASYLMEQFRFVSKKLEENFELKKQFDVLCKECMQKNINHQPVLAKFIQDNNLLDGFESGWIKHFQGVLQRKNADVFLFLFHDHPEEVSYQGIQGQGANSKEHKKMAELMMNEGINTVFFHYSEFMKAFKSGEIIIQDGNLLYQGKKVGGCWHHLMNTPEMKEFVSTFGTCDFALLPHMSYLSHKGLYAILSEDYRSGALDEKYKGLIENNHFAETIKVDNFRDVVIYSQKSYNDVEDLIRTITQEEKSKKGEGIIIKIIGKENAEGVTIPSMLSPKELDAKIKELEEISKREPGSIVIQKKISHKKVTTSVLNTATGNIEPYQGNLLVRKFFSYNNGEIISLPSLEQIPMGNKGHGMTDMVMS